MDTRTHTVAEPTADSTVREWIGWGIATAFGLAFTALAWIQKKTRVNLGSADVAGQIRSITDLEKRNAFLEGQLVAARAQTDLAYAERNATMRTMGSLETRVDMLTLMLEKAHGEQMTAADVVRQKLVDREVQIDRLNDHLTAKLEENTALTKEGISQASEAFREANDVNTKILNVGLKVADGTLLSGSDPHK
jgi:hypothetical protein